jgi:hypothetical protein
VYVVCVQSKLPPASQLTPPLEAGNPTLPFALIVRVEAVATVEPVVITREDASQSHVGSE